MIVVLDTNVLVSGLLSAFGHPGRVLDLFLTGDLQVAYDDRIGIEYRDVLARPRFGFDPDVIADVLEYLFVSGVAVIAHPLPADIPDPDDLPFLEVAAELMVPLITGNIRHFPEPQRYGVPVFSPAEFLAWWMGTMASNAGRR
jgi:predicted nucleic acid-binding protein